jgi:transcriptional regulator with XRE-family HTH domain
MRPNEHGEFLEAHRGRLDPQEFGLPTQANRRVAGLRREEVAVLAGVSGDYYTRLEQGRERSPSAPVLDALGRALRLSPDGLRASTLALGAMNFDKGSWRYDPETSIDKAGSSRTAG